MGLTTGWGRLREVAQSEEAGFVLWPHLIVDGDRWPEFWPEVPGHMPAGCDERYPARSWSLAEAHGLDLELPRDSAVLVLARSAVAGPAALRSCLFLSVANGAEARDILSTAFCVV